MENFVTETYQVAGSRKVSRFSTVSLTSTLTVDAENVSVITRLSNNKTESASFAKKDIVDVSFEKRNVYRFSDVVRFVVFPLVFLLGIVAALAGMPGQAPYGLIGSSLIGILISYVILSQCRHMIIHLNNGRAVNVPITANADVIPFLEKLNYPEEKMQALGLHK